MVFTTLLYYVYVGFVLFLPFAPVRASLITSFSPSSLCPLWGPLGPVPGPQPAFSSNQVTQQPLCQFGIFLLFGILDPEPITPEKKKKARCVRMGKCSLSKKVNKRPTGHIIHLSNSSYNSDQISITESISN